MSGSSRSSGNVSVPSATSLPDGPRKDYESRMRNYLLSMGIRTACFVAAVVLTGWLRWTCVALAVLLPYVAVVFANAASKRRVEAIGSVSPDERAQRIGPA